MTHSQVRLLRSGGLCANNTWHAEYGIIWVFPGVWDILRYDHPLAAWHGSLEGYLFPFFLRQILDLFGVPGYMICFPASLLFCFSCFSALTCFSAFLLCCFCTSVPPLRFYLLLPSVMCFCCSTFCSSASLLPVFTVSSFSFFFAFFSPVCILNETLERP